MIDIKDCWMKGNCKDACGSSLCMKLFKLNYLYDEALVGMNLRKDIALRPDKDNTDLNAFKQLKEIKDNAKEFVKNGNQLYIYSKIAGNGKTSWSMKILQSYFESIYKDCALKCKALFINVPYFLLALKDNISSKNEYIQHIKENVLSCDLIIWDDIGSKGATVFESENLLAMIDGRINSGKANIFTSNLNEEEIHQALGDRLASRIFNLGTTIEFKGKDKRACAGRI